MNVTNGGRIPVSSLAAVSRRGLARWQGGAGDGGRGAPLQPRVGALPAQGVLLDELAPRAAVQAELQLAALLCVVQHVLRHADGEGQVPRHLPHDDGSADVPRLDLHVAAARPGPLRHPQAAHLASAPRAVQEGHRNVLGGGLIHLLLCAATERLKDHSDLFEYATLTLLPVATSNGMNQCSKCLKLICH
uniref:Uncharacterized protein n=1 Tax=Paramormyrops kingsleyae TaxID=1676925 RepID=A0A3B3QVF3_9TELE